MKAEITELTRIFQEYNDCITSPDPVEVLRLLREVESKFDELVNTKNTFYKMNTEAENKLQGIRDLLSAGSILLGKK